MDGLSGGVQPTLEGIFSYAALGLIVGFGYYMSMRMNGGLPAEAPPWLATVVSGLRLIAAIAFFGWLASIGGVPVLSAFVGFLVGRVTVFRLLGGGA